MSTVTADDGEIHVWRMLACIALGVLASVGVFAATEHILLALGGYVLAACLGFSVLWVIGSAE